MVLLAISVGIAAAMYGNERRVQSVLLKHSQRQHVDALSQGIVADLETVESDLMVLAEGKTLAALLQVNSAGARSNLADEFRRFADRKRHYDQIRYLDKSGQEVVRVNLHDGVAQIVPAADLQSKSDRYYFQQAWLLDRNDIYVSPFDLNVENGQVEQPHKPTIRFATPVFADDGGKQGVLVVNYLGQHLLDKLERSAAGQPGDVMLLNAAGYFLHGPQADKEWAFMFDDQQDASFAMEQGEAWGQVIVEEHGQLQNGAGLVTFTTVHPLSSVDKAVASAEPATGYYWKLVSLVPPDELAAQSARVLSGILGLLMGVALLLLAVSWLLGWSLVQQRETRRRLAHGQRLAAIGGAMTALAHESRNALQRSQSGLEMLALRLPPGEETQQLLQAVQEAQYQLRDMYEQARDWAAPLPLQTENINVGQLAATVWNQLAQARDGRHDTLEINPATTRLTCQADRRRLSQVLRNIFENSLAATDTAHIQLNAEAIAEGITRLVITDDGPGLTEEQQQRIFEPFFTTRMRGTGLGMAICRRIVEAHGGKISTASTNGAHKQPGTTIVIELPRVPA